MSGRILEADGLIGDQPILLDGHADSQLLTDTAGASAGVVIPSLTGLQLSPAGRDLAHIFGNDLSVSATGDLESSGGTQWGQERVLRRLLTNPGELVFHPEYGAGLARFLGQPAVEQRIAAIIRSQIFQEAAVSRTPPPVITVNVNTDSTAIATIQYVDANTGASTLLTVPIGG